MSLHDFFLTSLFLTLTCSFDEVFLVSTLLHIFFTQLINMIHFAEQIVLIGKLHLGIQ